MHLSNRLIAAGATLAFASGCAGAHTPASSLVPATSLSIPRYARLAPAEIPRGTAQFVIKIDRKAKDLRTHALSYVSSKTQSMKIVQSSPRKKSTIVPLTSKAKGCKQTADLLTCTIDLVVEAGYQSFGVTLYASANATGTALSVGQAGADIAENRTAKIRLVLDAVVASMSASVQALSVPADGQLHTLYFTVGMLDATGAAIVGGADLESTITAQTTGSSGLRITPYSIQKVPKSDVIPITVTYGQYYNSVISTTIAFVTTTYVNGHSKTTTFLSLPFATLQASPKILPGLVMGASPAPLSAGVSEAGFSGVFKIVNSNPAVVTVACAPATCAPAAAGGTVDLTFTPVQVGQATIAVSDAIGTTYTYTYSALGSTIYTSPVGPGRIDNITPGPDGNIWGVIESGGSGEIAQIVPSTGTPTYYPLLSPFDPTHLPVAVAGPDNALWLVDAHSPYLYRVSTAAATVGQVTSVASADGANPTDIILGSDQQTLYYTDSNGNVGSYNVTTKVGAFSINPYDNSTTATVSLSQNPADGSIYFTDTASIFKLANGVVTSFANDLYTAPQILSMGSDGNLWYTQSEQTESTDGTAYLCQYVLSEAAGSTNPTCRLNTLSWSINSFEFGPDGAAWIVGVDSSGTPQLLRSTTTGIQTYFSDGLTCCPVSHGITTGPDGALWLASTGGVDRFALTQAEAATARGGASRASIPKTHATPHPKR